MANRGKNTGVKRGRPERRNTTAQAAVEYLTTYGWAILIVVAVLAILYVFVISSSSTAPQTCLFNSGAYCSDIVLGSNSLGSQAVLLLSNSQQYAISNPTFSLNLENKGNVSGTCSPSYVLPGGAMICSATLPSTYGQGTLVTGSAYITGTPCVSGSSTQSCSGSSVQTYSGSVNVHVQQPLTSNTITITLIPTNVTQGATGGEDAMLANVLLLGYPLQGASVNFAAPNAPFVTIAPVEATTDSNGDATSYASSTTAGNVLITAAFAGYTANAIVDFTPPLYITYTATNTLDFPSNAIIDINNVEYTGSQFPLTIPVAQGSRQTYAFETSVTSGGNRLIDPQQGVGCGVTGQSNAFIATYNCTIAIQYTLQSYLTLGLTGCAYATVSPGSTWADEGNVIDISTSTSSIPSGTQCIWGGWAGTGTGSSDSPSMSTSVTMNSPITETAEYTTQYTLTVGLSGCSEYATASPILTNAWEDSGNVVDIASWINEDLVPYGTRCAWEGWTGTAYLPSNITTITMTKPITETATYALQYKLTINMSGSCQWASTSPLVTNFWEDAGNVISITTSATGNGAPPDGFKCLWYGWTGSGSGSYSTGPAGPASGSITMSGPITETSVYIEQYLLRTKVQATDIGGSYVDCGTAVIESDGGAKSEWLDAGDSYTILATPDADCNWHGWTVRINGGSAASYTHEEEKMTMPANPVNATAEFTSNIDTYYDNDNCDITWTGGGCQVADGSLPPWADTSVYKSFDCVSSGNSATPTDCQPALFESGATTAGSDGNCIGYLNESGTYTEIYMNSGSSTVDPYGAGGPC